MNKRDLFTQDGVHLNESGSRKLADLINSRLYKNLEQPIKQGNSRTTTNKDIQNSKDIHKQKPISHNERDDVHQREPSGPSTSPSKNNGDLKERGTHAAKADAAGPETSINPSDGNKNEVTQIISPGPLTRGP